MQILNNIIQNLQLQNLQLIMQYKQSCKCIAIQLSLTPIIRNSVDLVFDLINSPQFRQERTTFQNPNDINVIIESGGGDVDAAYHIAKLIHSNFSGTVKIYYSKICKKCCNIIGLWRQ